MSENATAFERTSNGTASHDGANPLPGLYASAPEPLPFAPSLAIRAFLLRRSRGNVLIYSTTGLASGSAWIDNLGGASRRYLNHRHEAIFASDGFEAPLFVHAADRNSVARNVHVRGAFTKRHVLDEDFEVIPTPGHTPGATAYLWDSGEHRFLFTGDTVFLGDGEWRGAVLDSSDRDAYLESLELIATLEFDVLVPWAATRGEPYVALTDGADAGRRLAEVIERLRNGDDG